jgi:ATP-dependent RNA helicase DHX57
MLFGAIFKCLDSALTIAACLSYRSPFISPFDKRDEAKKKKLEFAARNSDHLTVLRAYQVSTYTFFELQSLQGLYIVGAI